MSFHPDITRAMASERQRDFIDGSEQRRLARESRGDHASLVSRMRERLPFVRPRERRAFRPAGAS